MPQELKFIQAHTSLRTWLFSMLNRAFAGSLEYQRWLTLYEIIIHSSEHTFNAKRKGK